MDVELRLLEVGTEFTFEGRTWEKGCQAGNKDVGGINKFGHKCYPLLGGKFQSNLGEWIASDSKVNVS